jgi:hypothetical protein
MTNGKDANLKTSHFYGSNCKMVVEQQVVRQKVERIGEGKCSRR